MARTLLIMMLLVAACLTRCGAARGAAFEENEAGSERGLPPSALLEHDEPDDEIDQQFYRENLEADLAPWRRRAPLDPEGVLQQAFDIMTRSEYLGFRNHTALYVVSGGWAYLTWLDAHSGRGPPRGFYGRTPSLMKAIENADGLVPDTMFLYNTLDNAMCLDNNCEHVPTFGNYKHWGPLESERDRDILIPVLNHNYEPFSYPWELKQNQALFRGSMWCLETGAGRYMLTRLSRSELNNEGLIDAGITSWKPLPVFEPLKKELGEVPPVSVADHARWKYLLNVDGCSAASRMAKLMMMNSTVVKEDSHYIEHYYRSLVDGHHLVTYNRTGDDVSSILPVLRRLNNDDDFARRVAANGAAFGVRHLTTPARRRYVRRALMQYNTLFGDGRMSAFVKALNVSSHRNVREVLQDYVCAKFGCGSGASTPACTCRLPLPLVRVT